MVFLWFSYGFPMVFLWFSYGFPMVPEELHTEDNSAASALPWPTRPRRRRPPCRPATAPRRRPRRSRRARPCRSLQRWRWPWLLLYGKAARGTRGIKKCAFIYIYIFIYTYIYSGLNIWTCAFQKHGVFFGIEKWWEMCHGQVAWFGLTGSQRSIVAKKASLQCNVASSGHFFLTIGKPWENGDFHGDFIHDFHGDGTWFYSPGTTLFVLTYPLVN